MRWRGAVRGPTGVDRGEEGYPRRRPVGSEDLTVRIYTAVFVYIYIYVHNIRSTSIYIYTLSRGKIGAVMVRGGIRWWQWLFRLATLLSRNHHPHADRALDFPRPPIPAVCVCDVCPASHRVPLNIYRYIRIARPVYMFDSPSDLIAPPGYPLYIGRSKQFFSIIIFSSANFNAIDEIVCTARSIVAFT